MKRTFAIVGFGALLSAGAFGQSTTIAPAFEVASVKANTSGESASADARNGMFTMHNMPMKAIIARAYQVTNDRVSGAGWLDTAGYDIVVSLRRIRLAQLYG